MGFLEILTKPIKLGSWEFYWQEPMCYRLRLRRDIPHRLVVLLASGAGLTGVLLFAFALSNNETATAKIAVGLGMGLGLGWGLIFLFGRQEHVSGAIWVYDDHIYGQKVSFGIAWFTNIWFKWFYEDIAGCRIIPASRTGHGFHVLLVQIGGEWEIIGVPAKVELKKLASYLSSRGVDVSPGKSVPQRFRKRLDPAIALAVPLLGVVLLAGGALAFDRNVGFDGEADAGRNIADMREQFRPDIDPAPPLPRAPIGPAVAPRGQASDAEAPPQAKASPSPVQPAVPSVPSGPARSPLAFPQVPAATDRRSLPAPRAEPPAITPSPPPQSDELRRTELVGGSGGFPRELVSPDKRPVIGLRYRPGNWSGRARVGGLEPLFDRTDVERGWEQELARQGYALGALKVSASEFVDAVAPVFCRIREDGTLDVNDSYTGKWLGTPEEETAIVDGKGAKVIGLYGRGGAVLDAVGLVLE